MKPSVASTMGGPRLHARLERQLMAGPGPARVDHPIAVRPVEPGAVLAGSGAARPRAWCPARAPGRQGLPGSFARRASPARRSTGRPRSPTARGRPRRRGSGPECQFPRFRRARPRSGRGRRMGHGDRRSRSHGRSPPRKPSSVRPRGGSGARLRLSQPDSSVSLSPIACASHEASLPAGVSGSSERPVAPSTIQAKRPRRPVPSSLTREPARESRSRDRRKGMGPVSFTG